MPVCSLAVLVRRSSLQLADHVMLKGEEMEDIIKTLEEANESAQSILGHHKHHTLKSCKCTRDTPPLADRNEKRLALTTGVT